MRKINFLLVSLLVVASVFFVSCSKDDEGADSFDFAGGTDYVSGDVEIEAGTTFKVKWTISTSENMKTMDITKNGALLQGWSGYEIPSDSKNTFIKEITITADNNPGIYTYKFSVFDSDDAEIISKSIIVTVKASAATLTAYTDKILGAQTSANGSSFLSVDGTVLGIADAKANSNKVDFMYYYSSGDQSTIVAPSDASAATQFDNATNGVATWSVRNATKLKKLTGVTFESITDASNIIDVSSTGTAKITALAVGDIVAFKTAATSAKASKKGVFKVTSISAATTAGSITIQVKVEN